MNSKPLTGTFGAELTGISVARAAGTPEVESIAKAYHEHSVLLLRDQELTPEHHIAFSRHFGELNLHVHQFTVKGHPEIIVLSTIIEDDEPIGGYNCALSWHTDGTHLPKPVTTSIMYCVEAPQEGGQTEFAGTAAAYEALPDSTKERIEGLCAIHSYQLLQQRSFPDRPLSEEKKKLVPDIYQPIVRAHPVTGRKGLYLGEHIIAGVGGMAPEDGIALVAELREHATQPQFVYHHEWRPGDLLMWDNRCTLHRALYIDPQTQRRRLHRTTINGTEETGVPVEEGDRAASQPT